MSGWGNLRRSSNALDNEAISVLIPAYKASKTIGLAVNSSLAALPANGRVIVFVDGECKDTERVLSQVGDDRLRWFVSKDNVGAREARQRLLDLAETELVATLDADDVCLPWRFFLQRRNLKRKNAEIVFSNSIRFGRALGFPWFVPELPVALNFEQIKLALNFSNPLVNSSMLARRSTLLGLGGYKSEIEDLGLWLQAAVNDKPIFRTGFWCVLYRVHETQLSRTQAWNQLLVSDRTIKEGRTALGSIFSQNLDLFPTGLLQEELRRRFLLTNRLLFLLNLGIKASLVYIFARRFRQSSLEYMALPVSVEVVGGLGNQLFGLIAGLYAASERSTYLIVHDGFGSIRHNHHGSTIRSFRLPLIFESKEFSSHTIPHHIHAAINLLTSEGNKLRFLAARILGVHTSTAIGFDKRLSQVSPGMLIRGYFQTHRFADELKSRGLFPELKLNAYSDWHAVLKARLKLENPVVIHVRRGDYAKPENMKIGQLSMEYFKGGVEALAPSESRPIWVFSDDAGLSGSGFAEGLGRPCEFIVEPEGCDPAEAMSLMSLSSDIVISNSTFSWWAAYLGNEKQVVAPSKWFRGMDDPEDLIPPSWLRVESTWL